MRKFLARTIVLIAALLILSALLSTRVPFGTPLNKVARLIEAFAPHLLLAGLALSLVALALGLRRAGAVVALIALTGGAVLGHAYVQQTQPLADAEADLSVLFLNANWSNTANADRIVSAVIDADPDIVALAEARAVIPAIDRLRQGYSYVTPCEPERCELLLATNMPVKGLLLAPLDPWSLRFVRLELQMEDGSSAYVAASHLIKPWFTPLMGAALAQIKAQYAWIDGPLIAVGDFNAPPWSRSLRELTAQTGLTGVRGQFGTWPSSTPLAFPIDQVLVGNGVRIVGIRPFGEDLGSNHRGFVVDVALPR